MQHTDHELVARAHGGDRDAFAVLVDRYQRAVVGVAFSIVRDRARAEDLAQEAFLAGWRSLAKLEDPARVGPWFAGIARNLANSEVRKQARRKLPEVAGEISSSTPFDDLAAGQLRELLRVTLDELPAAQREALVLYYFEDRSLDHVAAGLGVSKDVIKQRLHRARQATRLALGERLESALVAIRPAAAFTAAVVAMISLPRVTEAAAATTSLQTTGGKSMFVTKLALATVAVVATGTATIYTIRHDDTGPAKPALAWASLAGSSAAAPPRHAMVRRSASPAAHRQLADAIAKARARRSGIPTFTPDQQAGWKSYLSDAVGELQPLIKECLEHAPDGARIIVRCHVETEPDVGAVISSSEIVEGVTTIDDKEILDCVRETIASVELDPAEIPANMVFETEVLGGSSDE